MTPQGDSDSVPQDAPRADQRPTGHRASGVSHRPATVVEPTQQERMVMSSHGIHFDGFGFRFAGYRHDTLVEAIRASRQAGQGRE